MRVLAGDEMRHTKKTLYALEGDQTPRTGPDPSLTLLSSGQRRNLVAVVAVHKGEVTQLAEFSFKLCTGKAKGL